MISRKHECLHQFYMDRKYGGQIAQYLGVWLVYSFLGNEGPSKERIRHRYCRKTFCEINFYKSQKFLAKKAREPDRSLSTSCALPCLSFGRQTSNTHPSPLPPPQNAHQNSHSQGILRNLNYFLNRRSSTITQSWSLSLPSSSRTRQHIYIRTCLQHLKAEYFQLFEIVGSLFMI